MSSCGWRILKSLEGRANSPRASVGTGTQRGPDEVPGQGGAPADRALSSLRRWASGTLVLALFVAGAGPAGAAESAPVAEVMPVTALAFSPDGTALVSNGDRSLKVRDPGDATVRRSIPCDQDRITSLAFRRDGRLLAVGGGEPGVRGEWCLFTWPEGRLVRRSGGSRDLVTGVAFDAEGRRLAVSSADHLASLWELGPAPAPSGTGAPGPQPADRPLFTVTGHAGPVLACAIPASDAFLVTAGGDRSVKVWSLDQGRLLRSLNQHTEAIRALAFRPARVGPAAGALPEFCATAGDDRTVRVWQPGLGRMVRIVRGQEGAVLALTWSVDGRWLFSAGRDGVIRCVEGDSDVLRAKWQAQDDWIYALAASPAGERLASGGWGGRVRVDELRECVPGWQPAPVSP